ncbi:MAG: tetratricopeptide repeat protein, partial [Crocinitomicaceae bacterium]|nr:tetratricopeptide repeat protein [Crocinitomicaceae bacterium]
MKLKSLNGTFCQKPTLIFVFLIACFSLFSQTNSISQKDKNSIESWISQSKELIVSDESKAFDIAKRAVRLAKEKKATLEIAQSEYNLALLYKDLSMSADAIPHYISAIQNFTKLDSIATCLPIKSNLGRSYYALGDYPMAMETYMKNLSKYEELKIRDKSLAWLLRYIGSVFNRELNYIKAM